MADIYKVNTPIRKPLFEGVQGENEARSIQFDITPWVEELGDGAVTATAKRSQDSQPYPVTVTKDGNIVTWKPTSTDTAYAGVGSFQLEYTVDSVLAKTCIWSTMVAPSLDPAGDPPDPYDNWLAEMRSIAADAIQAADDAEDSADAAAASAASIAGDHNELLNIRVSENGVTYQKAGDAVRAETAGITGTLLDFECERGGYTVAGNKTNEPTIRLRVARAIPVKKGDFLIGSSLVYFSVIFTVKDLSEPNTDSGWVAPAAKWVAPADGYARVALKKYDNSTIADEEIDSLRNAVNVHADFFERIKTSEIEELQTSDELDKTGFTHFDPSIFQLGGLSNGVINIYQTNRVVTTDIQQFPYPLHIKIAESGFRFGVHSYNEDGTFKADSGWKTDYTIPANERVRILVQKNPDYTISTMYGFENIIASKIVCSTKVQSEIEQLENATSSDFEYKYNGEPIDVKKYGYWVKQLDGMGSGGEGTSAQGMAVYNGVLFQLYNPDVVKLRDISNWAVLTQFPITCEHGDSADFSNEFYDPSDEFPLLYITSDTTPAKVYVNRVTRSSATLVRTYYFGDVSKTGYYAGHCVDFDTNIIYMVGYTENSYYLNENNTNDMIVSSWDLSDCTTNQDGTLTPAFIESFTVPFIMTAQGQRFFDNKIFIVSSHNGAGGIATDTKVYVIDPYKKKIVTVFNEFPDWVKAHEAEGIEFIPNESGTAYYAILSCGWYWRLDFTK